MEKLSGKHEMTALDIYYLVRELKEVLEGGFFRKIYQWRLDDGFQFIFEIYAPKASRTGSKTSTARLFVDKSHIFLTTKKAEAPVQPLGFCQLLRKKLIGAKIRNIEQNEFNRIIEIKMDDYYLIIENFHQGNVIFCDSGEKIIMPLYHQTWKDRTIRPNHAYEYPPSDSNPLTISKEDFIKQAKSSDKKIVVFMSVNMGFGSVYANEILKDFDSDKNAKEFSEKELSVLFLSMKKFGMMKMNPSIYPDFVSPFPIGERIPKRTETFSEALDSYFTPRLVDTVEKKEQKIQKSEKDRIQRIVKSQEEAIESMHGKGVSSKEIGEIIYENYQFINNTIHQLLGARDSGLSWNEIKEKLKSSGTEMAKSIIKIDEKKGLLTLEITGKRFDIDYKQPLDKSATKYFETSKKMKVKITSAKDALEKSRKRLQDTEREGQRKSEKVRQNELLKKRQKSRWFDNFRWFVTSDGFTVVAGKDAETNEMLIKSHTQSDDFVLHSDIQGAAFAVIKSEGRKISDAAKKEAAVFAAVQSKAWSRGLGTVDVYGIMPKQVIKASPDGINLPKGSFYIEGEREWFHSTRLELALGFWENPETGRKEAISGPLQSVKARTKYYVLIRPGSTDAAELTKQIKGIIVPKAKPEDRKWIDSVNTEEIRRLIPGGAGDIR
ncbi:MAG: NFACT family protein [Candidatus Aenigmarchaeota archaeon]|nr:NFACT family protein [Candidatus Aenigmarchaeota archaeon]